ncbi:MAG: hypothetical protein WDO71_25880 [Bacteroidota bacterium]
MSREWNPGFITPTVRNLALNLGGIKSEDQLSADFDPYIKPVNYMGLKLTDHFTTNTNDPSAGYWLDGLPYAIDPPCL